MLLCLLASIIDLRENFPIVIFGLGMSLRSDSHWIYFSSLDNDRGSFKFYGIATPFTRPHYYSFDYSGYILPNRVNLHQQFQQVVYTFISAVVI